MIRALPLNRYGYDILKLLLSCFCIFLFIFLVRQYIPSYNGETFYFPIRESGSEIVNNEQRLKVAERILEKFDWKILKEKPQMRLSISIIAAERKNGYLTQSLAFLLQQVENWKEAPIISICNVETNIFDELQPFKDKLQIYSVDKDSSNSYDLTDEDGRIKKEANDYWNCLKTLYTNTNIDYFLLIEDDAVPVPHFEVLINGLLTRLAHDCRSSDCQDDIDYVKLFHPWRLRKIPFMFQAISISIVLGSTVSYFVFRRYSIIIILIVAAFSYSCFRHHHTYWELFADTRFHLTSSAYITPSESCCTPGVLFRSSSVPSMLKYFKDQLVENGHAKDHILDESPFNGKATDFNYFVHIGHFSSIRQKIIPLDSLSDN